MSFFDFDDKESSFFTDDITDNRAGEKRTVSYFDVDGDGDNSNSSDVQMKAPKMSKVDPGSGKRVSPESLIMETDKVEINANSKNVKVNGSFKEENTLLSDVMRNGIEEMRSKVLAMIPDIKRQEEASDSILGRVTVLESDINNYREQLAEVKHEYTSRLNQVSSILNMPRAS